MFTGVNKYMIVLTDGEANMPYNPNDITFPPVFDIPYAKSQATGQAELVKDLGIEIFTIGVSMPTPTLPTLSFLQEIASSPDNYYSVLDATRLSGVFQDIYETTSCGYTGSTVEAICCPLGIDPVDTDNDGIVDGCPLCGEDNVCNLACSSDVDCDDWKTVTNITGDQIDYIITGTIAAGNTGVTIVDVLTGGTYNIPPDPIFTGTQGT